MGITRLTICPHCQRAYKNPAPEHVGKEVVCRCNRTFVVEVTPPMGRRTGCNYNLVTYKELQEASERSSSPGGILCHEFVEILNSPEVIQAILNQINKDRRHHLDATDVAELIERLGWQQQQDFEEIF